MSFCCELPHLSEVTYNLEPPNNQSNLASESPCISTSFSIREPTSTNNPNSTSSSETEESTHTEHTSQESITDVIASYNNPYYSYTTDREPRSDDEPGSAKHRWLGGVGKPTNLSWLNSIKPKHSFTRQLNIFIGEEWENVHEKDSRVQPSRTSYSCPSSPIAGRLHETHPKHGKHEADFLSYPLQPELMQSRRAQHSEDPMSYFFFHLSQQEQKIPKDYMVKPNPYNKFNHIIHSILHCPCFFFFFLICCLPGIHFMQKSDIEYRQGKRDSTKLFSRRSSVLYVTGIIFGVAFLVCVVFVAVRFVQKQLVL